MTIGKINEKKEFVIEWSIRNFFSLPLRSNIFFESPSFSFANESWKLRIYPDGQKRDKSIGYIDLYLQRESQGSPINMEYSLGVKTADNDIDNERHLACLFERAGYGVTNLLSRTELYERKFYLLHSGTLTLVCRIKHSNFTEFTREVVTANCSHCKEAVDVRIFPLHEKKCLEKPIKCPECSDVIPLKDWYEHDCETERTEGLCKASRSYVDPPENKIQDFKQLFLRKEHCDVVFIVGDQKIHAHKAILSLRSSVFASTFRHNVKEKKTGVIDIEDFDPCIFSDFLYFLYCEEIESLSEKNAFGLFTAADKYDIANLKGKCMEFVKANLSIDTFCNTMRLALQHSETELISLSTNFFIKNAEKILETVQWQSFLNENPTYSNELFIKLVVYNKNSKK